MNGQTIRKPDGMQPGGGPTPTIRMKEFSIFKDAGKGPLKIEDESGLFRLAGGKDLLLKGDVTITSDIWQRFPYGIEIEGNLRCYMLMLDRSLKVSGSINASVIELRGDLSAGSIRACSVRSEGSVIVEDDIEATSLKAKTASAGTITGQHLIIAQHLQAGVINVETLKAGSAMVVDLVAPVVEVEYDLSCLRMNGDELTAGTIERYERFIPIIEVGKRTLTGKTGRPW